MVLTLLSKSRLPLTAEALYAKSHNKSGNLSTVYRVLSSFEKAGIVKMEVNVSGEKSYVLAGAKHQHVIICVECHKKTYLPGCPYHEVNEKISQETGYRVYDHNIQLYGLCPDCQKKMKK